MSEYEISLRSSVYPADIAGCTEETFPGKPLVDRLAHELAKLGHSRVEVVNSCPLWLVRVHVFGEVVEICVALLELHTEPEKALWELSVHSKRGFFARWLGAEESAGVLSVLTSIRKAIRAISEVRVEDQRGDWPL